MASASLRTNLVERRLARDMQARNLAARSLSAYRANARPELDITRDIDQVAAKRANLWHDLAENGPTDITRELVAGCGRELDFLYEELRITRMVTA